MYQKAIPYISCIIMLFPWYPIENTSNFWIQIYIVFIVNMLLYMNTQRIRFQNVWPALIIGFHLDE